MALSVTALAAAAAGFGVVVASLHQPQAASSQAALSPSPTPRQTQVPGGSSPQLLPGGAGGASDGGLPSVGPGETLELLVNGRVGAISGTSITLEGNGPAVTAAISRRTPVTGDVTNISGIKVGDEVTAQVIDRDNKLTITAIQDPAATLP
jgi:hypothetical protein